jgi:hypothetical protein
MRPPCKTRKDHFMVIQVVITRGCLQTPQLFSSGLTSSIQEVAMGPRSRHWTLFEPQLRTRLKEYRSALWEFRPSPSLKYSERAVD